ncbi:predicted protein [Streptomyces sp. C]|nr:predicted protein [Streptomyces sp. C]
MAVEGARPLAGNPCGARPPASSGALKEHPSSVAPPRRDPKESITMTPTTAAARRVRHTSPADADRKNAAAALQRALDRRDNGGSTGH